MMESDHQVERIRPPFEKISPLPQELNELIFNFLQLMYEGQYTRNDLINIPNGIPHTLMLNMKINILDLNKFVYRGKVDVKYTNMQFNIKFTMAETQYELCRGVLYEHGIPHIVFPIGPWATIIFLEY